MAEVAVTILAENLTDYAARLDRVRGFARRIHVDVADGVLAPTRTVALDQVYGIKGTQLDLHLMVQYPAALIEDALAVDPQLVILHAEAAPEQLASTLSKLRQAGAKVGLAIEPQTAIQDIKEHLLNIDHLLIFTGHLGYNGGQFDASNLPKIAEAKAINPNLEIGVDGGVKAENAELIVRAGADVLDVGSFIQAAADPEKSYQQLVGLAVGGAV